MYKVKFVNLKKKKKNSTVFIYPNNDDMDEITESIIICRLPEPNIGRRGELAPNTGESATIFSFF